MPYPSDLSLFEETPQPLACKQSAPESGAMLNRFTLYFGCEVRIAEVHAFEKAIKVAFGDNAGNVTLGMLKLYGFVSATLYLSAYQLNEIYDVLPEARYASTVETRLTQHQSDGLLVGLSAYFTIHGASQLITATEQELLEIDGILRVRFSGDQSVNAVLATGDNTFMTDIARTCQRSRSPERPSGTTRGARH